MKKAIFKKKRISEYWGQYTATTRNIAFSCLAFILVSPDISKLQKKKWTCLDLLDNCIPINSFLTAEGSEGWWRNRVSSDVGQELLETESWNWVLPFGWLSARPSVANNTLCLKNYKTTEKLVCHSLSECNIFE